MHREFWKRTAFLLGGFLGAWLAVRYLLPIFLPFLCGLLLALAAEPAVRLGEKAKLPRWAASGLGVSLTLLLLGTVLWLLGAALVRQVGQLAGRLPDLQYTAESAVEQIRTLLTDAAGRMPDGIRPLATRSVERMLTSGSSFVEQATIRLPGAISSVLQKVPDGALGIGTSLLSGFMFSARLSKLRPAIAARLPVSVKTQVLPALQRSKSALLGWLKAQATLAGITCCILAVGFLILRVPYWPVWAVAVALVDAVPLLGTGTVLIPWAVIDLIRGQHFMAIGLLCLYGVSFFTRTILEPRLVGRQLGIDPLVTLVFLYLGYRFWGIWGMLLSPMLVAALVAAGQGNKKGCA